MPRRTFWLVTGVAVGAGSSLWAERKVRHTLEQAAARLHPDALVVDVGRSARLVAGSAGDRLRQAVASGRDEMQRREEQLWTDLAAQGVEGGGPSHRSWVSTPLGTAPRPRAALGPAAPDPAAPAAPAPRGTVHPSPAPAHRPDSPDRSDRPDRPDSADSPDRSPRRVRLRPRREKSPSHLGN